MKIGRITLSDRASAGIYEDRSGPEIERVLAAAFDEPVEFTAIVMPDEAPALSALLIRMADYEGLPLVVTTGGTGPSPRDITPEATRAVLEKELPGFGELMRRRSYDVAGVPTAILSRATAGIRGRTLIVNLPGRPRAIEECLPALLPAVVECLEHISGFRPKLR